MRFSPNLNLNELNLVSSWEWAILRPHNSLTATLIPKGQCQVMLPIQQLTEGLKPKCARSIPKTD
jgi:hypothetical protein